MARASGLPRTASASPLAATEDDLGVMDFLEMFALSLTEGATEAIALMWETPALVITDTHVVSVDQPDELFDLFAGAREHYNSAGVTDTRPEIVRLDEITDTLAMVRVRWPWLDDEGTELGAECSTYVLRRSTTGDWKIRCAVMHGCEALN